MSQKDPLHVVPSVKSHTVVSTAGTVPGDASAVGVLVGPNGPVPDSVGLDRAALETHGFKGAVGDSLVIPRVGAPTTVVVGVGEPGDDLRVAAAAFSRAAGRLDSLALTVPSDLLGDSPALVAEALVEGALLARYTYPVLKSEAPGVPVASFTLVVDDPAAVSSGAERGQVLAGATALSRDLANTPHSHLSATRFAELAKVLGPERGLEVEVFGPAELVEMRSAGLLAVNAGSAEEPRFIKLRYRPEGTPTGRLALVGKGLMYDSGGLSLKPSDPVHAQMKNDMSGAAAVFSAMCSLRDLGCTTEVTGFLHCTDNMPSGTATALGDVVTYRDGTTMEVHDTDAEGRIVLADALILAREEGHDAVIDIATLTGSAMRALGSDMAGLFVNNPVMATQMETAAAASGEAVWELPLHRPYRKHIDSLTADMMNCAPIGRPDAIIAALFLAHFVKDTPWAHVDMCGPAQAEGSFGINVPGCSGWGARLLAHAALSFTPPT